MDIVFHGYGSLSDRALEAILTKHYLKRRPPMADVFEWHVGDSVVGVMTTGVPASRHLQKSACPSDPDVVVELNRLWLAESLPKGSASHFIARCIRLMPPRIVVSFADSAAGHDGTVYRACGFFYAGWTDMERNKPRVDYIVDGKHSRAAFRSGDGRECRRVPRKPKARYWRVTGNRREKRALIRLCAWPRLDWHEFPPPAEHVRLKL